MIVLDIYLLKAHIYSHTLPLLIKKKTMTSRSFRYIEEMVVNVKKNTVHFTAKCEDLSSLIPVLVSVRWGGFTKGK